MTKKITLEIPNSLSEVEVVEWVKVKVERHLRAIEEAKKVSIDEVIKPMMAEFDEKNGLKKEVKEEVIVDGEPIKTLDDSLRL
jgi:copper chaperone CopZ